MVAVEFRFLTGRYHATPWRCHVNEGAIEWPPSPWRLLRALLAVGFSKFGWDDVPDDACRLLGTLSTTLPRYWLPPASAAHTRHFMPLYKPGDKTKVFDTFAVVPKESPLTVAWEVELDAASARMLTQLTSGLAYLGRAESWVEARPVEATPPVALAVASGDDCESERERVPLLAPMTNEAFVRWRTQFVSEGDAKKHKSTRSRGLSVPDTVLDGLLLDTRTLHDGGWSQPLGSRWVSYWRPPDALGDHERNPVLTVGSSRAPTVALLALSSDTRNAEKLPRIEDTLARMEMLHDALVCHSAEADGSGEPSICLRGRDLDGTLMRGHVHASLLPVCMGAGGPGRIDHVLIHAPMGIDAKARAALERVRVTFARGVTRIFVSIVGIGHAADFERDVGLLRSSRRWVSLTPFVPPRYIKPRGKDTLAGQVRAELQSRGLPLPHRIEMALSESGSFVDLDSSGAATCPRPDPRWRRFRRRRSAPNSPRPVGGSFGLRITFETPVCGPISLGYASHFGLGTFIPEPDPSSSH